MKKKILLFMAAILLSGLSGFAQTWKCGDNLTATLSDDGILTISGKGEMTNYGDYWSGNTPPWNNYKWQIVEVVIGDEVTSIGSYAFYECHYLVSITISQSVTSIGSFAFRYCEELTSINIPASVTDIGERNFSYCFLNSIDVDSNNTHYSSDNGVLYNKNKTTLIHYPGGKSEYCFTIPESVTSVEIEAFHDCSNFLSIVVLNPVPFEMTPQIMVYAVYVPSDAVSAYKEADVWKNFNIVNLDDSSTNPIVGFLGRSAITTDNTKYTYYDAAKKQNVTISVPDQYKLECILVTSNFSGNLPLHFDIEDGKYTYDKIISVESNSIYNFSLYLNIGYNLTGVEGTDIWTTTHYIAGNPYSTEVNYRYHLCNVMVSKDNKLLSTNEFSILGSRISNISISDLTFVDNVILCGTNSNSMKEIAVDKIKIYPKPTADIVYTESESDIKVYNSQGILLQSAFGNQVDLSVYPRGLYLLQINGEMVKAVKK